MMLYKLLSRMDKSRFNNVVISLTNRGTLGKKIEEMGIPVITLNMERNKPNPVKVLQLAILLRKHKPDILQTWMYHADLIGGLAAKFAGRFPVVWNIRHSNLDPQVNKKRTLRTVMVCAKLSRWIPARIVCCSEVSCNIHIGIGYAQDKMVVIPNGFNVEDFHPDQAARLSVRKELNISEGSLLIGLVARFDSQKDHPNFIHAASKLNARMPDVHFLLCGEGITQNNLNLMDMIEKANIRPCCHLLGRREDISRLTAALDIATSSSCGEGFSNTIGEAMSCGVPCVVTDVGDSALIVGDTGKVVPPKNPEALAEAWQELIESCQERRNQLGAAARHRVEENFNLPFIVARYEKLYRELSEKCVE